MYRSILNLFNQPHHPKIHCCHAQKIASKTHTQQLLSPAIFCTEEHRLKHFTSSADIAVALLASATCGISGLPFKFRDEEGQEQTVADGAALGRVSFWGDGQWGGLKFFKGA